MDEDLKQLFSGMNIGSIGQFIGKVESGATVINNNYGGQRPMGDYSDVRIGNAVKALLRVTLSDGTPLMRDQRQWFAVYRVLTTYYNYPVVKTQFVTKMADLGVNESECPGMPRLTVDSLRQAGKDMPQLATLKPADWNRLASASTAYKRQWDVVQALNKEIENS